MPKVTFDLRDDTLLRIKILAMYFTDQAKKLAEEENLPEMAHVWTESGVIDTIVGEAIAKISDEGVDLSPYLDELIRE
jgi:hypothetical protein